MDRYNKYAIGAELRKRTMAALSFVVRANAAHDKTQTLTELRIVLEELRQLLFLGKETKALASFSMYKERMERLESISRQNEGWLRSQKKNLMQQAN